MKAKPELTFETIKRMEDMTWFTHELIFDDLIIVAQKETACYIWKTAAGLVVIDGIWPDKRVYDEIITAIKDAGWGKENGYEPCGAMFNIYHVSPHETQNPDEFVTEVCYPIK